DRKVPFVQRHPLEQQLWQVQNVVNRQGNEPVHAIGCVGSDGGQPEIIMPPAPPVPPPAPPAPPPLPAPPSVQGGPSEHVLLKSVPMRYPDTQFQRSGQQP